MGRAFLPFGSLELNQVRCLESPLELVPVKEPAGPLSWTDLHPASGGPLGQVTEKKLRVKEVQIKQSNPFKYITSI